MAKREIVTLNESTPQLEVPQTGDTYQLPRDVAFTTGVLKSEVANGAAAVAFDFDTDNAFSTTGAKLASFKNSGVEKIAFNKDGSVVFGADLPNQSLTYSTSSGYEATLSTLYGFKFVGYISASSDKNSDSGAGRASFGIDGLLFEPLTKDIKIEFRENWGYDQAVKKLYITGAGNWAGATTNLLGGDVIISGGKGSSGSSGNAHGGNVEIKGGTGYGTGHNGYVMMTNLPTSNPSVTGALWNDSGTLKVSA